MNMNVGEMNSIEEIVFEEHIVEATGWSWSEFNDMLDEVCREGRYHPDDDRQEAVEQLAINLTENARRWMLPKYVKKFEKEIKELEEFEHKWNKAH
jgi:hypothetical protein